MARIGTVSYLNAQPLVQDLVGHEINRDHPSVIAAQLASGEVDVALVPVAAVLAGSPDLRIIPGFCIGASGPVRSVLLVAETEPEEWTEVLLDGVSRTSVILAQLLLTTGPLAGRVRADLRIVDVPAGTGASRAAKSTAAVVIGDAARLLPDRLTVRIDLAEVWTNWTKLPFVFAVWAGGQDLDPLVIRDIRDAGRSGTAGIAERYSGADLQYLTENIRYALDEKALMGLRRFAAMAKRAGLLPSDEVRLFAPSARIVRTAVDVDTLLAKGASGERLSWDEGVRLDRHATISDLGAAADLRKQMLHPGKNVTYIISRNINYTNVCVTACKFCAFYRPKRHAEAYVLSRETMAQKIQETVDCGGIEILLQGGLHPELGIEWYEDLFRWVKQNWPMIALHALSPEEIYHIMGVSKLGLRATLERLVLAGMDSIPGGGAEVLDDDIRKKIAPLKASTQEWLDCMEEAHKMGLRSSATMMFGVGETTEHRLNHFDRLRQVQDRTGGFTAFICWTFVPDNTYVKPAGNTGADYLRTNALARLYLDNFQNLQASWVTQGPGVAQASLHMGCNDYGSAMLEENVVSAAGSTWSLTIDDLERNIRAAGFIPVRRNMRYQRVGDAVTAAK